MKNEKAERPELLIHYTIIKYTQRFFVKKIQQIQLLTTNERRREFILALRSFLNENHENKNL
jgi:hypothetical protein